MNARRRLALLIAIVLAASVPAAVHQAARVDAAQCINGWRQMPMGAAARAARPMAAASLDGRPAWWVGKTSVNGAMISRWNGTRWVSSAVPWTGDAGLSGVSAWSSSAAWVVGYRSGASPRSIAGRWNGSSWSSVTLPTVSGQHALADVVALGPAQPFAVGSRISGGRTYPLAFSRTTSGWVDVSPSLGSGAEGGLTTVSALPGGPVWAAGWRSSTEGAGGFVAYHSGQWTVTPISEVPNGTSTVVTDLFFRSASDGWLVGHAEAVSGGGYIPTLQHWDGTTWSAQPLAWAGDDSLMPMSVTGVGPSELAISGIRLDNLGPSAVLLRSVDGAWVASAARADRRSWAYETQMTSNGAFAVTLAVTAEAHATCGIPTPTAGGPGSQTVRPRPATFDEEDAHGHETTMTTSTARRVTTTTFGDTTSRDVTDSSGIAMTVSTFGGVAADFDGNGWVDVFVNRHIADVPVLMSGGPDGFTDSGAHFEFFDRHGCTAADISGDDQLDLFCSAGRWRGSTIMTNELLVNVGESGGTLSTLEYGVANTTGRGRTAEFIKLASDELPALFIGNEPARIDGLSGTNRFYRNVEGTHFVPAPEAGLDNSLGAECAVAANIDADADDELLICSQQASGGKSRGLRLFDFDGSGFVERGAARGLSPIRDSDIEVGHFNGDELLDIAQLNSGVLRVSLNGADGFASSFSLTFSGAVAMAVGDVDGDDRDDIYVRHTGGHRLLVNGGNGKSFAQVPLPGTRGGSADDVAALDYDNNGRTDFLTFNGRYSWGPLQLLGFFPNT